MRFFRVKCGVDNQINWKYICDKNINKYSTTKVVPDVPESVNNQLAT